MEKFFSPLVEKVRCTLSPVLPSVYLCDVCVFSGNMRELSEYANLAVLSGNIFTNWYSSDVNEFLFEPTATGVLEFLCTCILKLYSYYAR